MNNKLRCDAIEVSALVMPIATGGLLYDFYSTETCEARGKTAMIVNQECPWCDEMVNQEVYQNIYWPLPHFTQELLGEVFDSKKRLNLWARCGVGVAHIDLGDDERVGDYLHTSDEWGLVLMGGGMDMSWDIAGGYVAMGYNPPVAISRDLPAMAGTVNNTRTKQVLTACHNSMSIQSDWNKFGKRKIATYRKRMRDDGSL